MRDDSKTKKDTGEPAFLQACNPEETQNQACDPNLNHRDLSPWKDGGIRREETPIGDSLSKVVSTMPVGSESPMSLRQEHTWTLKHPKKTGYGI